MKLVPAQHERLLRTCTRTSTALTVAQWAAAAAAACLNLTPPRKNVLLVSLCTFARVRSAVGCAELLIVKERSDKRQRACLRGGPAHVEGCPLLRETGPWLLNSQCVLGVEVWSLGWTVGKSSSSAGSVVTCTERKAWLNTHP